MSDLVATVAQAFAPQGPLARADAHFHPRAGQTALAQAVARTIAEGGVLVAEAGTGVGKTFAYLVPALLSGERVLVSTATKALQDQLDACVRERAPDRFGRLNNEWHRLIVEGSGNKVIADHLQRLNVPIHRLLFESFYDEERLKTANADHQAMLALILAGDADGAERAMRQHIGDGFETLARIEDEFYR